MKQINILLFAFMLIFSACDRDEKQLFDKKVNPAAPVLMIEGAGTFVVTEEFSDYYYSVLSWSKANFGKGISAGYVMEVSDNEFFDGSVVSLDLGQDVYMKTLTAAELYGWSMEKYGVLNEETGVNDPANLYFRIIATEVVAGAGLAPRTVTSNGELMTAKWADPEEWEPEELTIRFNVLSGDWGEYAVYAWGESEVYGAWPGEVLTSTDEGWYEIKVPVNRPVNLIINNNNNGKQFDFLQDPTESLCYEFEIGEGNNNCEWTEVECPEEPSSKMFMIGDEFGSWNWGSDGVVEMTPVWEMEGHFWAIRYISAGKGFKWSPVRDWEGDFFSLGEDQGFYTKDNNAFVENSGMYMIYLDRENGKISVEPAKVYGMGDCFGGWDIETYLFETEDNMLTYTTTGSGELRMYAASDISGAGGDWWKMEFVILEGKIAYRGNGGDQTRVSVEAGKKVTLNFNTGEGTIK